MNGRTKTQLANLLAQHLSESELISLALSLNVDYENLEGKSKSAKALDLIVYMDRRGRSNELLDQIEEERPDLSAQVDNIRKLSAAGTLQQIHPLFPTTQLPTWVKAIGSMVLLLLLLVVGWRWLAREPAQFTYQVKVQDNDSGEPLQRAKATLVTGSGTAPDTQITDANGFAIFTVPDSLTDRAAMLTIEKQGYQTITQNVTLTPEQLLQDIIMQPDP